MLKIQVKTFSELTLQELYSILQLRSEVFMDGKDQKALHVLGKNDGVLVAYTRIFKPGDYFKESSIGRVVVSQHQRKHRYGYDIMKASIAFIENNFKESNIKISAQCYLKTFYNNLGFVVVGEQYLEDGIPHYPMLKQ